MDSMHEVLSALKKKERHLKMKVKSEKDADARASIVRKRRIVREQRKKGLTALKGLQKN